MPYSKVFGLEYEPIAGGAAVRFKDGTRYTADELALLRGLPAHEVAGLRRLKAAFGGVVTPEPQGGRP